MTDSWMTWAARPEELGPPIGLLRKDGVATKDASARSERDMFTEHASRAGATSSAQYQESNRKINRGRRFARTLPALAAVGLAGSAFLATPGCESVPAYVATAAVSACVEIIKNLFPDSSETLPDGFVPCGQILWPVQEHEFKFCLYCNPLNPHEAFVQFGCAGKYFPMQLRRIESTPQPPIHGSVDVLSRENVVIEKMTCEELFMTDVITTVAPSLATLDCSLRAPNGRVMPSIEHYESLEVRVDGVPVPRSGDFEIESGSIVDFAGSFNEVAHYAMTCGVQRLSFKDGSHQWTVFANPDVSAIAVFRDAELYESRFLFAPRPRSVNGG